MSNKKILVVDDDADTLLGYHVLLKAHHYDTVLAGHIGGGPKATVLHKRDDATRAIPELKRFEQTLQQKNVELEDASRMKSEFLANMSRELRMLLNAIVGFSEVIRDSLTGEMTDQQRGFIGDIFSSGRYLLSLPLVIVSILSVDLKTN
jgi:signal transduction histidine kinase